MTPYELVPLYFILPMAVAFAWFIERHGAEGVAVPAFESWCRQTSPVLFALRCEPGGSAAIASELSSSIGPRGEVVNHRGRHPWTLYLFSLVIEHDAQHGLVIGRVTKSVMRRVSQKRPDLGTLVDRVVSERASVLMDAWVHAELREDDDETGDERRERGWVTPHRPRHRGAIRADARAARLGESMTRRLRIAEPCSREWEAMAGDARVRHCDACKKEVHDLSALDAEEAERVLARVGSSSLCLRVKHDDEGNVWFRQVEGRTQRWLLAVGASVGLAACAPPPAPRDASPAPRVEQHAPSAEDTVAPVDAEGADDFGGAPQPLPAPVVDPLQLMRGDPPTRSPSAEAAPGAARPLLAKPEPRTSHGPAAGEGRARNDRRRPRGGRGGAHLVMAKPPLTVSARPFDSASPGN